MYESDKPLKFAGNGAGSNQAQRHSRDLDEQLVCEALVCEIRDAKRWVAVMEAFQALLAVRRMAESLRASRAQEGSGSQEPTRAA